MPSTLASQFGQALGLSPADAERALAAVDELLRTRLDASGVASVEGLGVFRKTNGQIEFEPAPVLVQAVNHRYEGLPAIPAGEPAAAAPPAPPVGPPAEDQRRAATEKEEPPDRPEDTETQEDPFAGVLAGPSLDLDAEESEDAPIRDLYSSPDDDGAGHEAATSPSEEAPAGLPDQLQVPVDLPEAPPAGDVAGEVAEHPEREDRPASTEEPQLQETVAAHTEDEDVPSEESLADEWAEIAASAGYDDFAADADDWPAAAELPEERAEDTEPEAPPRTADDQQDDWAQQAPAGIDVDRPDLPEEHDEEDDLEDLLAGIWTARSGPPEAEHPLGPMPPEILEDADFQVVAPLRPQEAAAEAKDIVPRPVPLQSAHAERPTERPPAAGAGGPAAAPPAVAALRSEDVIRDAPRQRKSGPGWLLIGVLVVAVSAAAVVWLLRQPGEAEQLAAAPTEVADEPQAAAAPEDPVEEAADEVTAEEPVAPPVEDGPLRSPEGVDPARGGYTFVISEPSAADAGQRAERYRQQGYRVSVIPATVRGTTYHRVAIGQFSSPGQAERFRDQLPADVPQDIWILAL